MAGLSALLPSVESAANGWIEPFADMIEDCWMAAECQKSTSSRTLYFIAF
jgi:hypothetical protein